MTIDPIAVGSNFPDSPKALETVIVCARLDGLLIGGGVTLDPTPPGA